MPKIVKPAGTPCFPTREECVQWMADRVVRWTYVLSPHGVLEKRNFQVKNTKHPDFKPEDGDEPLLKVARPAKDGHQWFAYMPAVKE